MQEGCASLSPAHQEKSFYEIGVSMEDNFFCAWGRCWSSVISCCASYPDTVTLLLLLCSGCLLGVVAAATAASAADWTGPALGFLCGKQLASRGMFLVNQRNTTCSQVSLRNHVVLPHQLFPARD